MKKHNGMRPQDIAILMAIVADTAIITIKPKKTDDSNTKFSIPLANNKKIAQMLNISESEVSESLHRSSFSGLIDSPKRKKINKKALMDFLLYGIKYVFPTRPGSIVRGIATAHSAEPLKSIIVSEEYYVWEHPEGNIRGQIIEPLYPTIPSIVSQNNKLYELLSLIDAIRTGTARVFKIASEEMDKRFV
ncbi:hypothetical protein [Emticicia fontis]